MTKYTFKTDCAADVYTKFAEGVNEVTFIPSADGRVIVQDAADTDPAQDASGWMPVDSEREYRIRCSGLELYYRPWGVSAIVSGMKK